MRLCVGVPRPSSVPPPAPPLSIEADVVALVRSLAGLTLEELRAVWRAHIGPTPSLRSHDHLRRLLAWRLQAEAMGGLDAETRRALAAGGSRRISPTLPIGARLTREWRGRLIEAEIAEDGVLHAGRLYASLSEVAREVTGTRWSGPRFFGLTERAAQP